MRINSGLCAFRIHALVLQRIELCAPWAGNSRTKSMPQQEPSRDGVDSGRRCDLARIVLRPVSQSLGGTLPGPRPFAGIAPAQVPIFARSVLNQAHQPRNPKGRGTCPDTSVDTASSHLAARHESADPDRHRSTRIDPCAAARGDIMPRSPISADCRTMTSLSVAACLLPHTFCLTHASCRFCVGFFLPNPRTRLSTAFRPTTILRFSIRPGS